MHAAHTSLVRVHLWNNLCIFLCLNLEHLDFITRMMQCITMIRPRHRSWNFPVLCCKFYIFKFFLWLLIVYWSHLSIFLLSYNVSHWLRLLGNSHLWIILSLDIQYLRKMIFDLYHDMTTMLFLLTFAIKITHPLYMPKIMKFLPTYAIHMLNASL